MNIVIDNNTYTVDQLTAMVRKSRGSVAAVPSAGPYHPQTVMLVDRILESTLRIQEPHAYMAYTMLKGALLKTAKAHEILTTSGDVAQAIEALEASMSFSEE